VKTPLLLTEEMEPKTGQTAYIEMTLPTTILAENVDNGANGVAYFDYGYGGNVNAIRPTWSTEHNSD
jgi:hypothetical protein